MPVSCCRHPSILTSPSSLNPFSSSISSPLHTILPPILTIPLIPSTYQHPSSRSLSIPLPPTASIPWRQASSSSSSSSSSYPSSSSHSSSDCLLFLSSWRLFLTVVVVVVPTATNRLSVSRGGVLASGRPPCHPHRRCPSPQRWRWWWR